MHIIYDMDNDVYQVCTQKVNVNAKRVKCFNWYVLSWPNVASCVEEKGYNYAMHVIVTVLVLFSL